ncbi:MAG TPA: DUF4149 domain-containing protein [Armatimonadota bacterium]|nr:DUF4149 domain-containing protein [Armatimonadota bacterium]
MDPKTINRAPTTPLAKPAGTTPLLRPPAAINGNSSLSSSRSGGTDPRGLASTILVLSRWLQNLVIGVWLGAILTVGVIVATVAVSVMKTPVAAGTIIGPAVNDVTKLGGICGVIYLVMLLIHDPLWKKYHPTVSNALLSFLKTVLAAAMVGASGYLLYRVGPQMTHYLTVAHVVNGHLTGVAGRAFDWWHKLYVQVTQGIFGGGLLLLLLTQMSGRKR